MIFFAVKYTLIILIKINYAFKFCLHFSSFQIDIFKANGNIGSYLPISVTCEGEINDENVPIPALTSPRENVTHFTDKKGHLIVDFLVASNVKGLHFKVRISPSLTLSTYISTYLPTYLPTYPPTHPSTH